MRPLSTGQARGLYGEVEGLDGGTAPEYLTPLQRFGVEVREVRRGRKITQKQLGAAGGYSEGYVSKIEAGAMMPSEKFARTCDHVFGTHGLFDRLRRRIQEGDHPSWFAPYADLERDSLAILDYSPTLVMGMLQTPEYSEAVFRARYPREGAKEIKSKVEARVLRRAVMTRPHPPLLWVILYESCLRAKIGGAAVMRGQIEHLLSEAESPHVTLQLLPFDAGAPPATEGFTVLRFAHRPDVVYADSTFTGQVMESATTVEDAKETYDRLRAAALHPDASLVVMRKYMKEYEQ